MSEHSPQAMAAYDEIFKYFSNFIRCGGKISREEGAAIIDEEFDTKELIVSLTGIKRNLDECLNVDAAHDIAKMLQEKYQGGE